MRLVKHLVLFSLIACSGAISTVVTAQSIEKNTIAAKPETAAAAKTLSVAELIEQLKDPKIEVRLAAVKALGQSQDPAALKALIQIVQATDQALRPDATYELGNFSAPEALATIRASLADPNWLVRARAAGALAIAQPPGASGWLIPMLRDQHWLVRAAAATSISNINELRDLASISALTQLVSDSDPYNRGRAAVTIGHLASSAPDDIRAKCALALTPLLKDGNESVRRSTAEALGTLKDKQSVDALIALLKEDSSVRPAAAIALGKIGDRRAVTPLREIPNPDWVVSESLFRLGDSSQFEKLAALLTDGAKLDGPAKRGLIDAFGGSGDKRAGPLLTPFLKDKDAVTRQQTATALGQLKEGSSAIALSESLKDSEPDVRLASVRALSGGTGAALDPLFQLAKTETNTAVLDELAFALKSQDRTSVMLKLLAERNDEAGHLRDSIGYVLTKLGITTDQILAGVNNKKLSETDRIELINAFAELDQAGSAEPLSKILSDNTESIKLRQAAISSLGRYKDVSVITKLVSVVRDTKDETAVRATAATTLAVIHDRQATEPLMHTLKEDNVELKRVVAEALGHLGDHQAVEPLLSLLDDQSPQVRESAAAALTELGVNRDKMVAALKNQDWQIRSEAVQVLTKFGDQQAVPALIVSLNDENVTVRLNSTRALGSLKDQRALGPLVSALKDKSVEVRTEAATALSRLGDPSAIPPLLGLINDHDSSVSAAAAHALISIGSTGAANGASLVNPLVSSLSSSDWHTRARAAQVLGSTSSETAIDPLLVSLRDKNGVVRYYATRSLVALGPVAVPGLVKALRSTNKDDRYSATLALSEIGKPALEPLIEIVNDTSSPARADAALVLGKTGELRAVAVLIKALEDQRPEVRQSAAIALAQLGDIAVEPMLEALAGRPAGSENAVSADERSFAARVGGRAKAPLSAAGGVIRGALKGALGDPPPDMRPGIIQAFGLMGDDRATQPLSEILANRGNREALREAAADALGGLKSPGAVAALAAVLRDDNLDLGLHAARSLGHMGDPGVTVILGQLRDSDPRRRLIAIDGLSQSASPLAITALMGATNDSAASVRAVAVRALSNSNDERVLNPVLKAMRDPTNQVRRAAFLSAAKLGDRRAFEPLVAALKEDNPEVRMTAVQALGELGDPRAVQPLQRIVDEDTDDEIRNLAAKVLQLFK